MKPGVGTNRFSYAFNDPINLHDQNGNFVPLLIGAAIALAGSWDYANAPTLDSGSHSRSGMDMASTMVGGAAVGRAAWGGASWAGREAGLFIGSRLPSTSIFGLELGLAEATGMTAGVGLAAKGGGLAQTTARLQQMAKNAAAQVGPGKGTVHGTKVHSVWGDAVENSGLAKKEVSYKGVREVPHGHPGSIRCDFVCGTPDAPTAIFDLKTGTAGLGPRRIAQIRSHLPLGYQNIPIIEIRP